MRIQVAATGLGHPDQKVRPPTGVRAATPWQPEMLAAGASLKEIDLGPVWSGPVVSRGRIYVGTGNLLFWPENPQEAYFPKSATGSVRSFGLPREDETDRLKSGDE